MDVNHCFQPIISYQIRKLHAKLWLFRCHLLCCYLRLLGLKRKKKKSFAHSNKLQRADECLAFHGFDVFLKINMKKKKK